MKKSFFSINNILSIRNLSAVKRCYSVCWPKVDYGPMEVQRSELLNGIKVACAKPMGSQIAACTIMYQAGSRYEIDDQIGATHFIRACSSASGRGYTSFAKMRFLQQHGAYITCTSDRQYVAFTLRCPVTTFPELKYYLLDVAARCYYNQWEVDDRKQFIKDDLQRIKPEQHALDLLQRACWGGPLANSVFCEEERIDSMTQKNLDSFVKDNFRTDECSVASVGVPFEETLKMAEKIDHRREKPEPRCVVTSFARGGFEYHDLGPNSDTWIAVAVPGCGTCDLYCLLKHAIVAAACGTSHIQMGQHTLDRTPQPPLGLMAGDDVFTEYKAFNISYRDTGLFGILAKTRAASARNAAFSAAEFLLNVGDLDFKQIEVGKRRLKVGLAFHDEDCVKMCEGLALQAACGVQIDSAKNSLCMIDLISPDEVTCTARGLSSKREYMAVAVVGDVGAVPHDRELLYGF